METCVYVYFLSKLKLLCIRTCSLLVRGEAVAL